MAEDLSGPIMTSYRHLATESGLWLSLGGFQEKIPNSQQIYNTHVVIDQKGNICAVYRKIHLFTYSDPENEIFLDESNFTSPGEQIVTCDSDFGRLGLTICYDLRFPQVYQELRFSHGAEILLVPSAFTVPTGKAHWEALLRSRAIETQSYVLAAAQTNRHNHRRESYGHTLAVGPWGEVLVDLGTEEGVIGVVDIDLDELGRLRQKMPLEQHRSAFLHSQSQKR